MDLADHPNNSSDAIDDVLAKLKKFWPKQTQDQLATVVVLVGLPLSFLFEILVILPSYYPTGSPDYNYRVVLLFLLGLNFFGNWYKMVKVGPNGKSSDLPSVMRPGFKYCHVCHLNAPPRSHHCPVCDRCIFKRDHHCSFAAVCVGHFNHRYFIVAAIYIWLCATIVAGFVLTIFSDILL